MSKKSSTFARSFACITKTRPIHDVKPDRREVSLRKILKYEQRLLTLCTWLFGISQILIYCSQGIATMNVCLYIRTQPEKGCGVSIYGWLLCCLTYYNWQCESHEERDK